MSLHGTASRRAVLAAALGLGAISCSPGADSARPSGTSGTAGQALTTRSAFDRRALHEWTVTVDHDEFVDMVEAYLDSDDKEWLAADVLADGRRFVDAGLRLKGNSSLAEITTDSDPAGLPWLIELDKDVEQTYGDRTEFVVRSNTFPTALNEAVALDLLAMAGLASQRAVPARFSVNGGDPRLRLLVEHPDARWEADQFGAPGVLFKAEAGGDYSYRGADADSYVEVFEQVTGEETRSSLTPLIEFLRFINNAGDRQFRSSLRDRLDVVAFARYLAFEDLVRNADDIGGLGNNSYLRYNQDDGRFTVVAWDHNLAFSGTELGLPTPGTGDTASDPPAAESDEEATAAAEPNVLLRRFAEHREFRQLYDLQRRRLRAELFTSRRARRALDQRAAVLRDQATDLVDAATIEADVQSIRSVLDAEAG